MRQVQLTPEERQFLEKHPTIVLGTDSSWSPYVISSRAGGIDGFDYEILNKINELTGADFRLRTGTWAQMLKMAKAGLIDGLSTSAVVEERRQYFNFSLPYTEIFKRVIVQRGNPKHIESKADLAGKVIVIQEGNASSEKVAAVFNPSRVLRVSSPKAMVDALISGKADATFDDGTFLYTIREYGLPFVQVAFPLDEKLQLVFSVRKDWPEAVSILDKGLGAIPAEEKKRIYEKWFTVGSESVLRDGWFSLTAHESEYLKKIKTISLCIDPNWMPYEELSPEGRHVGLVADFMAVISSRIGKPLRLVKTVSWPQSLQYARERKCDILSAAVPTPKRKDFLNFSTPYVSLPLVVATGLDKVYIEDFASVANRTFAVNRGYAAIELLRAKYPNIRIIEVDDVYAGLSKVREKEVFGYIDTVASIGYQFQKHGILDVKISGQIDIDYDITVAVRNDEPELLTIINKAIASISKEERQFILNHWLSVRYEKGFDYSSFWKLAVLIGLVVLLLSYRYVIVSRYNKQLLAMNAQLDLLYKSDRLTGIANRHVLDEELEKELARSTRYGTPFSLIMLDIDWFKNINDTYGHYNGDTVLQKIAKLLELHIRKTDVLGRWGGEEFLIICSQTDLFGARKMAEHLRESIEQLDYGFMEEKVTASFGVAPYIQGDTSVSIIKRVDAALYRAKDASRNCVVVAEDNIKQPI